MSSKLPSYLNFNSKEYAWKSDIDYKKSPLLYKVGKGEQGVLICEPYKTDIGKFWRFKTPEIAKESANSIFELFLNYVSEEDFVGADMARKFLQMGFTRSRRYYNYKGGKKYDASDNYHPLEKGTGNPLKAESANIFYKMWRKAEKNPKYAKMKKEWVKNNG